MKKKVLNRGQDALEYLLILSGGIILVVIVLSLLFSGVLPVGMQIAAGNIQSYIEETTQASFGDGPPGPICGNTIIEPPETCDDGNTNAGDGCSSSCTIESSLPVCGNTIIEFPEECDDGNEISGDGCSSACMDEVSPPTCGDGFKEGSEVCDAPDFGIGSNLCSIYNPTFISGTLSCINNCGTIDATACSACGNGTIDTALGEECDGTNVGGETCLLNGFSGGSLTCNPTTCTLETSSCLSTPTFLQLKDGSFPGILHCGGPTYGYGQYDEYLLGFPTTKPAMFVHYFSLFPQRKLISDLINNLENDISQFGEGGSLGNAIPFFGISYTESTAVEGVGIGHDADVASGAYDENLVKVIQVFKDYDKPFFIRPGFEFNGSWNGYLPEEQGGKYEEAWIHIYDKFQEMGVTKGIWVWDHMPTGNLAPFQQYYPGDAYVDYYGVNLFGQAFNSAYYKSRTTEFVNDAIMNGKPLLIPESAPQAEYKINSSPPDNGTEAEAQEAWDEWFTDPTYSYLQFINNPANNVKGFCYSNGNYSSVPGFSFWNNMNLHDDDSSWLKDEWQDEMNNSQYLHETG